MSFDERLIAFDWTNALEIFKPASAQSEPQPAVPKDPSLVSVADLKSSGVWIEWFEAVAIVQATCRTIIDSGDPIGPARLEARAIFVDPNGGVTISSRGPRSAPEAIQSLGNILSDVLPPNDFMLLRTKVVANATSAPPLYHSLEEFSQALSFYERPHRDQLVLAVYDRWRARPIVPAPPPVQVEPEPVFEPVQPEPAPSLLERFLERVEPLRDLRLAAGLILLVAVIGTTVWALGFFGTPTASTLARSSKTADLASSDPTPGRTNDAAPSVKPVAIPSARQTNRQVAPHQSVARTAGSLRQSPSATTITSKAPRVTALRTTDNDPSVPVTMPRAEHIAVTLETTPSTTVSAVTPPAVSNIVNDTGVSEKPIRNVAPDPGAYRVNQVDSVFDPTTYNASDIDVVPPVAVYPQFLVVGPAARRETVSAIEVIINERGTVDAVKLVKEPRNIGEFLLVTTSLSATKSWRFQPAVKDGHAVRYRTLIPVTR